jgi:hypothetical protein
VCESAPIATLPQNHTELPAAGQSASDEQTAEQAPEFRHISLTHWAAAEQGSPGSLPPFAFATQMFLAPPFAGKALHVSPAGHAESPLHGLWEPAAEMHAPRTAPSPSSAGEHTILPCFDAQSASCSHQSTQYPAREQNELMQGP